MNASAYLIRRGDLNPGWVPLYAGTWLLQWFCAGLRYFPCAAALLIVNLIAGWELPVREAALVITFAPLAFSLATLVLPLGSWWWEQREGGRRPSEREQTAFGMAFSQLRRADPELRAPHRWFVVDDPEPNACVYGGSLMVTRGMLDDPFFPAVLAHELGHLNSSDGRVTAAVYRITVPPRNPQDFPLKTLAFLFGGRVGMVPVRPAWGMYWRRREAVADAYAAKLGQGPALATYLDTHALSMDLPMPFKDFGESSHPWTEHRIESLQARSADR